jgi:redox-sensitive bicupin YhaK (pirin superfamily)
VIQKIIQPHLANLVGELSVRRILPRGGRGVGPFLFLDDFGPWEYTPGTRSFDVPPHPHIGLSTLTYLTDGEILHRDSLGSVQPILPGDVNWMTAGRGIVHSERISSARGTEKFILRGLQAWVALPGNRESCDPSFTHHPRASLPRWRENQVEFTLLAGLAFGRQSPVECFSRLFYFFIEAEPGGRVKFSPDGQEVCFYLRSGVIEIENQEYSGPILLVFRSDIHVEWTARTAVVGAFLGGDSLGPRHMFWNFVASSRDKIETAKRDWEAQKFPKIAGETEWIPLPTEKK